LYGMWCMRRQYLYGMWCMSSNQTVSVWNVVYEK